MRHDEPTLDEEREQAEDDQQQQDDSEVILEHDLHSLYVAARSLSTAPGIGPNLRYQLQSLLRSLTGCYFCKRRLDDLHTGGCVTGGNRVLFVDLKPPVDRVDESRPF